MATGGLPSPNTTGDDTQHTTSPTPGPQPHGARLIWETKVGDKYSSVNSVSFLLPSTDTDPSTSGILYFADGDLGLVSVKDGRPLNLSRDTTGLDTAVSRDQRTFTVAGWSVPGYWWRTFSRQEDGSWDRSSTLGRLLYPPQCVAWTADNDFIIVGEAGQLDKYSPDGRHLWAHASPRTHKGNSSCTAACDQDSLYVSDWRSNCVRVYSSSSGELQDNISQEDQDARYPLGLCVSLQGTLFVGYIYRSRPAVLMRLHEDAQWLPIITKLPESVRSLAISGRHLAVGDKGGMLRLYEVT